MTETFIKERQHNLTGKVEPVGIDDACAFLCRFAQRLAGARSSPPATPAGTRRCTRSRSTAKTPRSSGICTICTGCKYFDHRDEGSLRGWRSIHVTDHGGDHPYMDHWWVPGLQIGYEHSFIHQVADFVERPRQGRFRSPDIPRCLGNPEDLRRCARQQPLGTLANDLANCRFSHFCLFYGLGRLTRFFQQLLCSWVCFLNCLVAFSRTNWELKDYVRQ